MDFYAQIQKLFYDLFDIAGFDEDTKTKMVGDVVSVWAIRTFGKVGEILDDKEKNTVMDSLNSASPNDVAAVQKEIGSFISGLDERRQQKVIEFGYSEAAAVAKRMIEKFNLKSTPEQKAEFAKRLSVTIPIQEI